MPRDYRSPGAEFSQVGFHFRQMFKCLFTGISYFFQNAYCDATSAARALIERIALLLDFSFGDRFPRTSAFFSYHWDMMVKYRSQLGARFATYMLIGVAIGQVPLIFAAKAGVIG